jgi:hypothetical protein
MFSEAQPSLWFKFNKERWEWFKKGYQPRINIIKIPRVFEIGGKNSLTKC